LDSCFFVLETESGLGFSLHIEGHDAPRANHQHLEKMNTYTIKNSFTGYTASIRVRGENLPSASTLRRHFRAAKASDCKSSTICRDDQTGERVVLTPYGVERIDA
jgi:hypothetical protein